MPAAELSLRAAERADLDAIAALEQRCFHRPWTRSMLAEELTRGFARVDIAARGGGVLGYTCVWEQPPEAHLLKIAVAPEARGGGVGGALLRRALHQARVSGCEQVQLEVARANASALRLYQRAGFTVVGTRPGYYRDPVDDAVLMTRLVDH
ncbi:MAG: ribosomal protein S18-alanine N-acetyltransferase [Myxococcales bacterium]|nr:ribosomal protein S18-alanine N-acetyltransferase [Myxococcales bacterium]